jgi:hypothetical protein
MDWKDFQSCLQLQFQYQEMQSIITNLELQSRMTKCSGYGV